VIHLTETQLNEYLDQAMEEGERPGVEEHLATCDQCQVRLKALKTVFLVLEELPEVTPTRDLTSSVLAGLPVEKREPALLRQPAFLLQSTLTILLLAVSMPILRGWGPRLSTYIDELVLPRIQIPSLLDMVSQLEAWQSQLNIAIPEWSFSLPSFNSKQDARVVLALAISIAMLWMIGNLSLLRGRPESKE